MWLSPFCDELLSETLGSYRRRFLVEAEYEMVDVTYIVPDLASDQGERTVSPRLLTIPNVEAVVVDLETKGVTVHGRELDTIALRATIESAGGIPSGLNEVERLSGLGRLDAFAPGPPVAGRGRSRNAH